MWHINIFCAMWRRVDKVVCIALVFLFSLFVFFLSGDSLLCVYATMHCTELGKDKAARFHEHAVAVEILPGQAW